MFSLMPCRRVSYGLSAAAALSLCCSASAFALDAKAFMSSVQNTAQDYGLSLHYQNIQVQDNNIILQNVRLLQREKANAAIPLYLGTVRFDSVTSENDGSFTAAAIISGDDAGAQAAANLNKNGEAAQIIVQDMQLLSAHIGTGNKTYALAQYLPYKNLTVKNVTYKITGKNILSLDNITAEYRDNGQNNFENTSKIASFTYDPTIWPGQDGRDAKLLLTALHYDKIRGSFSANGIWNPQNGDLQITEYKLTGNAMGSITVSGHLGGVTQAFTDKYQKLALQQVDSGKMTAEKQKQLRQDISALTAELKIHALSATYQDNSLVGRFLDYFSQASSIPRRQLVAVLKAAISQNTQYLKNRAFTDNAVRQINRFLDNPRSLQIAAQPPAPVAFSSVMPLLNASPEQLMKLLAVSITANK